MVANCPYCLETCNHFIATTLDADNQVEIEVVADKDPCLMVRYFHNGWFANKYWSVSMRIKYCPMCGRKLTDG